MPGLAGLLAAELAAQPLDDLGRWSARGEYLLDALGLQLRDVLAGDDAAPEDEDVAGALLAKQLHHARKQGHVRTRVAGEADRVGVLLDHGLRDLLGRLVQTRVDDLEPRVAEGARDDLRAPVVPVQSGLRDDDPERLGHAAQYTRRPSMPRRRVRLRPPGLKPWTRIGTLGPFR